MAEEGSTERIEGRIAELERRKLQLRPGMQSLIAVFPRPEAYLELARAHYLCEKDIARLKAILKNRKG